MCTFLFLLSYTLMGDDKMKKIIPFTKEIPFKTNISEITDIEVTHTLKVGNDNEIDGSFLVDGTYKITDASLLEEKFNYDLPFTVEVDDKYDLSESIIKINDFYFEILNEDTLKINIELEINGVKEKEIPEVIKNIEIPDIRCFDEDDDNNINNESEILDEFTDIVVPVNNSTDNNVSVTDIFSNINNEDTYRSYYVYKVTEMDTIDSIINKYKVTKEDLSMYNNLNDIKTGSKIIIPCSNE